MKYDFSKISNQQIEEAMHYAIDEPSCCYFRMMTCKDCPLKVCTHMDGGSVAKLLKEELNRREKMENKMPKLEAGMIVELNNDRLFIVLPSTGSQSENGLDLYSREGTDRALKYHKHIITALYRKKEGLNYRAYFKSNDEGSKGSLVKIWSKKSDKDIKIEELEKTINEAQRQIQELKG